MPIYEYRCEGCRRKVNIFFRSMAVVETNPECPHCGERRLAQLMSRVWSRRSSTDDDAMPQPSFEDDGVPFYGADPFADTFGSDDPYGAGIDQSADTDEMGDDVAAMAREARMMAQMMGEPLDDAFDTALRHVEQGADPDEVFGELDAAENTSEPPSDGDP